MKTVSMISCLNRTSLWIAKLIMALFASAFLQHASASGGGEGGRRHGPPEAAFTACAQQSEEQACQFEGRNRTISGACYTIHQRSVCVPAHHFKKGGDQPTGNHPKQNPAGDERQGSTISPQSQEQQEHRNV